MSRQTIGSKGVVMNPVDLINNGANQTQQVDQNFKEDPKRKNRFFHHYRFLVVVLSGLSVGIMHSHRYNISVAILKMVNQTAIYLNEHPNKTIDDFRNEEANQDDLQFATGEFEWDNKVQQMIMSWYLIAYTLPQVPMTKLCNSIGARVGITISLLGVALTTILVPPFAYFGWQWVIVLRLISGVSGAAIVPAMVGIIECWMPHDCMTLGLTCAQVVQAALVAVNPMIIGYLCSIHWKWAFYVPGAITIVFCVIWYLLVTQRPEDCYLVSNHELSIIKGRQSRKEPMGSRVSSGSTSINDNGITMAIDENSKSTSQVTVLDILKVPSFHAFSICCLIYCGTYSCFTFILPPYLKQFLKIPISQNGFYNFLIHSGAIIAAIWPHIALSTLRTKFNLGEMSSRRLCHLVCSVFVMGTWLYVGWFNEHQLPLLFINRAFQPANDIIIIGVLMLNYAKAGASSLAFSMMNTIGNLLVPIPSIIIGWVLDYTGQSVECWGWIYTGMALSQFTLMIIFCTMISAKPIEFNKKNACEIDAESGSDKTRECRHPVDNTLYKSRNIRS